MSLSIIVVSFNTRDLLRRCLASLGRNHEVIVVDNASSDGSAEMVKSEFPQVRLIANDGNLGFGAANNVGLDAMTGDMALLLNSDAFATEGAVETLLAAMEDETIVACGGRLLDPGRTKVLDYSDYVQELSMGRGLIGTEDCVRKRWREAIDLSTQNSCSNRLSVWAVFCEQTGLEKLLPGSPVFSPYWCTQRILQAVSARGNANDPRSSPSFDVAQVMGACLMMRPVERFDERFFLYCEDTELCRRLSQHGRIVYVPDAVFGHELGASSASARWESVARYNRGKELYFAIHHGRFQSGLCWILNRMGAILRFVGGGVATLLTLGRVHSYRYKAATFWRVLTAPVSGPPDPRHAT